MIISLKDMGKVLKFALYIFCWCKNKHNFNKGNMISKCSPEKKPRNVFVGQKIAAALLEGARLLHSAPPDVRRRDGRGRSLRIIW